MFRLPTEPDTTPTYLYNPAKDDFSCKFDNIEYVLPSRIIKEYPKYLADHIAKHLARKLALDETSGLHFEDRYKKWLEKIYVKLD